MRLEIFPFNQSTNPKNCQLFKNIRQLKNSSTRMVSREE